MNTAFLVALFLTALSHWGHVWPGRDIEVEFRETSIGQVTGGYLVNDLTAAMAGCHETNEWPRHCVLWVTPRFWTFEPWFQQQIIDHEVGHILDLPHPTEADTRPSVMREGPLTGTDKRNYLDRWGLHSLTVGMVASD